MIEITTARTTLRVLGPEWSDSLLRYRIRNREHLAPWEPTRDHTYYTAASSKERLEKDCEGFTRGQSICLWGVDTTASDVIGSCNFTNIVWGPFQACHLGFSVDADYQGKGYMREMVEAAIDHVFGTVLRRKGSQNRTFKLTGGGKIIFLQQRLILTTVHNKYMKFAPSAPDAATPRRL